MKNRIFFIYVLIFSLLQVTFVDYIKIFGAKPDLFAVAVVIAAIYFAPRWALAISLFAGILKDTFSIDAFGINTLLLPILCFLVMRLSKEVTLDNIVASGIVTFVVIIVYALLSRLISMYSNNQIPFLAFLRISFFEALYTALIFPLIFRITRKAIY